MGFTVTFESLEQTCILREALNDYIISLKIKQEYGSKAYPVLGDLSEHIDYCEKLYNLLSSRELEIEKSYKGCEQND